MRRKENLLILFLLAVLFLIFFSPSLGWKFRAFLAPGASPNGDYKNTVLENDSLKTELAKLRSLKPAAPRQENLLPASVYSNYPFNFKNELLVNIGGENGVKIGQPVFIYSASSGYKILVGKVEEVLRNNSLVETIFDSRFQMSARVGESGVNSLLKGGNTPFLSLMPKDSKVAEGDAVYSASRDFPFGLTIGKVKNLRLSSDGFFMEADLDTTYNVNDLITVFIDTAYEPKK